MVANQFTIVEHGVRPDVIAFANGIPLVVIELKSASDENVDITDAYNQLQTYKMTIPSLFTYNSFMVTSDGVNARAGTLSSDEDRFMACFNVTVFLISLSILCYSRATARRQ